MKHISKVNYLFRQTNINSVNSQPAHYQPLAHLCLQGPIYLCHAELCVEFTTFFRRSKHKSNQSKVLEIRCFPANNGGQNHLNEDFLGAYFTTA